MKKHSLLFTIVLLMGISLEAQESIDQKWYFQPSAFFFDLSKASTETNIGGSDLPGENISFSNSTVPGVGVGYFVNTNISIHTVIAYPPSTTAKGKNNLEGQTAGEVTYAPFAISGLYHYRLGNFQPFLGGGFAYAVILDAEDGDVSDIEADNAFGFIIRGGFDYMVNNSWGASLSVNRLFIDTEITGDAGGAPAKVDASLNPWVYSIGVIYRR
ncbi:OmpW family outer membrane protein [Ekhidna sp.]|uniref:OmpW/AlkL family protein n=1 Tax=Ekhidna sp. TaxID=2608089 RepID=UPI0032994DFF